MTRVTTKNLGPSSEPSATATPIMLEFGMAYRVRTRNRYDPTSPEPYKLSRSQLQLFLACPRCFYLDRRLGIDRVPGPAFTLNSAYQHGQGRGGMWKGRSQAR